VIFDHIVRNPLLAERGEKGARSPAKFVHNDYTFKSAPRRVRDLLPEEAGRLLKNRFAEINVWRAIRGPIEVRLSRCATPAAWRQRISCRLIWSIASVWAKSTASLQPEASLVLLSAVGTQRSSLTEVLRLQGRRPRALHRAYLV